MKSKKSKIPIAITMGEAAGIGPEIIVKALEKKELSRWQSDLNTIASLAEDASLIAWLESPKFRFEDKAKVLSESLGEINPLALNLVHLLVAKGGMNIMRGIADEYHRLLDSYGGVEHADVITAVPLDEADKPGVAERLGTMVGKKVVLKSEVDSSVIGGIVARVGGKLIDGSTRNKLETLKQELVRAGK